MTEDPINEPEDKRIQNSRTDPSIQKTGLPASKARTTRAQHSIRITVLQTGENK
jgi:hypothetical protein